MSFYEEKKEERKKAKDRRDSLRKGIENELIDQGRNGKWKIPPKKTTSELLTQQRDEMIEKEKVKYSDILDDFGKNTTWQDQLKSNLNI